MKRYRTTYTFILPVLIAVIVAGCNSYANSKQGTYAGDAKTLGYGEVRSWVRLDVQGNPEAVGVTLSGMALRNLPDHGGRMQNMIRLDLPPEAALTPFDHVSVGWNPHDREGEEGYPHFGFHFYQVSEMHRATMVPTDLQFEQKLSKAPPAELIPAGYVPMPGGMPMMGARWVDAPVLEGEPFEKRFIYGAYNGKVISYQPMITKSFLESRPDVRIPIAQPQRFEKPGYYPTHYSVRYDENRNEYTVALEGMTYRQ